MESKIYTLYCSNPLGALGENTFKALQPKCSTCKKEIAEHIKFSEIELIIEWYKGEDLFCTLGALMVTEALYNELIKQNITGFAPIKVTVKRSKYYDGPKELPKFIGLAVLNSKVRNIPIAYDYTEICSECKGYTLQYNPDKMKNMFREKTEDALILQVYPDQYDNEDIFGFMDHPEFGITEKFKNVLQNFNCPETTIIPAEFIATDKL